MGGSLACSKALGFGVFVELNFPHSVFAADSIFVDQLLVAYPDRLECNSVCCSVGGAAVRRHLVVFYTFSACERV